MPRALTPDYVNTASGLELHQFKWLANDDLIGEIPARWNHLVGYNSPRNVRRRTGALHTGRAAFSEEYRDCEYADAWRHELEAMLHVDQRQ